MNNEIASSAPLERARQRQAEMRAAGIVLQRRDPIEKAQANPPPDSNLINRLFERPT